MKPMKEDKWQIECDAKDLKNAEIIKQDPKRLKAAMKYLNKDFKAIESLKDLREVADEKLSKSEEENEEE